MPNLPEIKLGRRAPAAAEVRGVVVTSEQCTDQEGALPWPQLNAQGFTGSVGESAMAMVDDRVHCIVGLGEADDVDGHSWRRAGVELARAASRVKQASIDASPDADIDALSQGLCLGAYGYDELKSDAKPSKLRAITIAGTTSKKSQAALDRGVVVAAAACIARDLVNEPGGSLTPERFANEARRIARQPGLSINVHGIAEIRRMKLGGLLGVNRGSDLPPRLVEMSWRSGRRGAPTLALVGKGITFDSGGLSIKPAAGMLTMKCDMGGGAAVIGAMSALPSIKPAVNVKAWVPMTDNMLGGDATRVGDVLRMRDGKSIEVLNTDAEGRLILADGLSLASEAKPDAIVDLATLTGAAMVGLGRDYAALMSNDDGLASQIEASSSQAGELVWRLPLPPRYRKQLDSPIADMKNIGGPYGGAITAGLFLQEFVADGIAWAHIDIAGPAFTDALTETGPKGGTGYGVATLISLIENFTAPEG